MTAPLSTLLSRCMISSPASSMAQQDDYGLLETWSFSWGTFHIFAAYVALISICIGDYRHALEISSYWKGTDRRILEGRRAIWRGALEAICIFSVLVLLSAIAIPLATNPLDQRMVYIIEGFSRMISAIIVAMLSLRVAIWVGLYYHPFRKDDFEKRLGTTIVELKHRVRWSVSKRILRSFFYLWILFQGADALTIPLSILCGLCLGFFIDWGIYKCRRLDQNSRRRKCLSVILVLFLTVVSILQFSSAIFFISAVWEDGVEDVSETTWDIWAFFLGILLLPLIHLVVWKLGQLTGSEIRPRNGRHRPRMATSMIFSDWFQEQHSVRNDSTEVHHQTIEVAVIRDEEGGEIPGAVKSQPTAMENIETATANDEVGAIIHDKEAEDPLPNNEMTKEEEEMSPTLWELIRDWQWCGCARGDAKTTTEKVSNVIVWFLYLLMCAIAAFSLVCNSGSTYQQEHARSKLPDVHKLIYKYMDEGPVCAFDNKGTESNITTFSDKDAAHEAGFMVLHCGACGACSDWQNLELEYTTRNFLAREGKACAQKSLFGSYDSLVECLEAPKIGFQGQCAICWADDILCTKDFCWAIGIQSFFINTLTSFQVQNDTITAAACEEAHCEAGNPGHFVSCSGATRRRMNVTSKISRPGAQQCSIVDVDWAELFPDPHPNET